MTAAISDDEQGTSNRAYPNFVQISSLFCQTLSLLKPQYSWKPRSNVACMKNQPLFLARWNGPNGHLSRVCLSQKPIQHTWDLNFEADSIEHLIWIAVGHGTYVRIMLKFTEIWRCKEKESMGSPWGSGLYGNIFLRFAVVDLHSSTQHWAPSRPLIDIQRLKPLQRTIE